MLFRHHILRLDNFHKCLDFSFCSVPKVCPLQNTSQIFYTICVESRRLNRQISWQALILQASITFYHDVLIIHFAKLRVRTQVYLLWLCSYLHRRRGNRKQGDFLSGDDKENIFTFWCRYHYATYEKITQVNMQMPFFLLPHQIDPFDILYQSLPS